MKVLLMHDCFNAYSDLNLPINIYTETRNYQLGAAIIQNSQPITYYSWRLMDSKKNYTTTEQKLLAIVLVLKEYKKVLLGAQITIRNDHKNLTFHTMSMQWVLFTLATLSKRIWHNFAQCVSGLLFFVKNE